jgi:hypothetical protein
MDEAAKEIIQTCLSGREGTPPDIDALVLQFEEKKRLFRPGSGALILTSDPSTSPLSIPLPR